MPTDNQIIDEVTYDVAAYSTRFNQQQLKRFQGIVLGPDTATDLGAGLTSPQLRLLRNDLNAFIVGHGGLPLPVNALRPTLTICQTEKLVGTRFNPNVAINC